MYGKTKGLFQPSEASNVLRYFFGGGHPSQVCSAKILSHEKEKKLESFLQASYAVYNRPLIIKNAWNCFRLKYLTNTFPHSYFVWVRRDLLASAKSDLNARYITKGDKNAWNSATPANYKELKKRHYCEQVVEHQYEFAKAIKGEWNKRFIEVWYDEFCLNPQDVLLRIGRHCRLSSGSFNNHFQVNSSCEEDNVLSDQEILAIKNYIRDDIDRFRDMVR